MYGLYGSFISLFDLSKFRISNYVVNTNIITAMVHQIWKDKNRKSRIDIAVVPTTFYDLIENWQRIQRKTNIK